MYVARKYLYQQLLSLAISDYGGGKKYTDALKKRLEFFNKPKLKSSNTATRTSSNTPSSTSSITPYRD